MLTELDLKVLALAEEICNLYGGVVGNRICQDWLGETALVDALTDDEKKALAWEYEQYNSKGEDYDPDCLSFHDGMMVSFYVWIAMRNMRKRMAAVRAACRKGDHDHCKGDA